MTKETEKKQKYKRRKLKNSPSTEERKEERNYRENAQE
jgi:hypothetical protein